MQTEPLAAALAHVEAMIDQAAASAGVTPETIVAHLAGDRMPPAASRKCKACGHPLTVVCSKRTTHSQIQYLACRHCGVAAGKASIPADMVKRRRRRSS